MDTTQQMRWSPREAHLMLNVRTSVVTMFTAASSAATTETVSVKWRGAVNLPLPVATFDVALCQQTLQFLPDQPTALREMWRILRANGRLVLSLAFRNSGSEAESLEDSI